jgi:hypothetical protein
LITLRQRVVHSGIDLPGDGADAEELSVPSRRRRGSALTKDVEDRLDRFGHESL